MIDIKFLRENPEVVKKNIENKFQFDKLPLVDKVIELDEQRRKTQQEADSASEAPLTSKGQGRYLLKGGSRWL